MIKNIFLMVLVSFFISACSTNQLVINPEKKMEREKVSKELLDDVLYIVFLLKQNNFSIIIYRVLWIWQYLHHIKSSGKRGKFYQ